MKKYRIKVVHDAGRIHPGYLVQVRSWWGAMGQRKILR